MMQKKPRFSALLTLNAFRDIPCIDEGGIDDGLYIDAYVDKVKKINALIKARSLPSHLLVALDVYSSYWQAWTPCYRKHTVAELYDKIKADLLKAELESDKVSFRTSGGLHNIVHRVFSISKAESANNGNVSNKKKALPPRDPSIVCFRDLPFALSLCVDVFYEFHCFDGDFAPANDADITLYISRSLENHGDIKISTKGSQVQSIKTIDFCSRYIKKRGPQKNSSGDRFLTASERLVVGDFFSEFGVDLTDELPEEFDWVGSGVDAQNRPAKAQSAKKTVQKRAMMTVPVNVNGPKKGKVRKLPPRIKSPKTKR